MRLLFSNFTINSNSFNKNKSKIMSLSQYSYKLPESLQNEGYHLNRATNKKSLILRRAVINFKHFLKPQKANSSRKLIAIC